MVSKAHGVNVVPSNGSPFIVLEQDVPLTIGQYVHIASNYRADVIRANAMNDEHVLVSEHGIVVFLSKSNMYEDRIVICVQACSSPTAFQEVHSLRGGVQSHLHKDTMIFGHRDQGKEAWDTMRRNGWRRLDDPSHPQTADNIKVEQYGIIVRNLELLNPEAVRKAWFVDDGVLVSLCPNHSTGIVTAQMSNYSNYQNCRLFDCLTLKRGIYEKVFITKELLKDLKTAMSCYVTGTRINWEVLD